MRFIAELMESDVKLVSVEYPDAPELLWHILAAVAQEETRIVSARTGAAMRQAKARGRHIGSRRPEIGLAAARAVHDARRAPIIERAAPVALELREQSRTLREIAAKLTTQGIPTARGGSWYAGAVRKPLAVSLFRHAVISECRIVVNCVCH